MYIHTFKYIFHGFFKEKVNINFTEKLNIISQGKNNWKKVRKTKLSISFWMLHFLETHFYLDFNQKQF